MGEVIPCFLADSFLEQITEGLSLNSLNTAQGM